MNNEKGKINYQREIELLLICTILTYMATYLFGLVTIDMSLWTIRILECIIYIVILMPALAVSLIQRRSYRELFKLDVKQCVLGMTTGLALAAIWGIVNYVFKLGLIGMVASYKISTYIYHFIFYVFFVALAEEFVFRIYYQDTFEKLLGKARLIAPALSAAFFGLYHIVNCDWANVVFAFVFGLIWGYIRFFWRKCTFAYLVLVHGFFDFGIYLLCFLNFIM